MNEANCTAMADSQLSARKLVQDAQGKVKDGTIQKMNLVWLELAGCSGNIISLLDGAEPGFKYLVTQMANILYSNSLMAAQGEFAMEKLFNITPGSFVLVVEGAVSTAENGRYNIIGRLGEEAVTGSMAVRELGERASHVIAMGACASHGGVSAARPNLGACVGVQSVLARRVINLPGCPCHPDWVLGTLGHILLYGEPELDGRGRPLLFYKDTIHDRCPRRSYFDNGVYAEKLGDPECMFKLGCRGPVTRIDCPVRKWNEYVNWPVGNGSPCIGCAQFGFPDAMEPFVSFDTIRGGKNG
ncbi:MAG: hydrogenase small subunit [Eubacteriales bacterium]